MKKTQIFAGILCLGITATLMTGCGKSGTVVSDKEDDSALAGKEHIMAAYEEAVKERYRFFSFGDAMMIE